jgi:Uncharacterized conserved protein
VSQIDETRLKRLRIRCWRRGTREMDLLLGGYADGALTGLAEPELAAFEALLEEQDQDLYAWISGAKAVAPAHGAAIARIQAFHGIAA